MPQVYSCSLTTGPLQGKLSTPPPCSPSGGPSCPRSIAARLPQARYRVNSLTPPPPPMFPIRWTVLPQVYSCSFTTGPLQGKLSNPPPPPPMFPIRWAVLPQVYSCSFTTGPLQGKLSTPPHVPHQVDRLAPGL